MQYSSYLEMDTPAEQIESQSREWASHSQETQQIELRPSSSHESMPAGVSPGELK
jgi:hypothetical protein